MKSDRRRKVFLDDKIEIFKRYFETAEQGDKLTGKTSFEGFPIGQWAIQIRAQYNRGLESFTTDQIDYLTESGILDRKIEATIDEKIDALIKWKNKHPDIRLTYATDKYITEYLENNGDIEEDKKEELLKGYQRMQKYLAYLKNRTYHGKLKKEQLNKLKQASFDRIYGYSDEIEGLSLKYRISTSYIKSIIDEYGSMEKYISFCKENGIIPRGALNIDYENSNEDKLIIAAYGTGKIYSGKRLKEVLKTLTQRERDVLIDRFGLDDGKPKGLSEVAIKLNVTGARISQIEAKGLRKLNHPNRTNKILVTDKGVLDEIYNSNAIFYPSEEYQDVPCDLDFENLRQGLEKREKEREESIRREEEAIRKEKELHPSSIPIEELDLSVRAYNCLKRIGINYVGDLLKFTKEDLKSVRSLGQRASEEVLEKLKSRGVYLRDDEEIESEVTESLDSSSNIEPTITDEAITETPETNEEVSSDDGEKTELEEARRKRDELREYLEELNKKVTEAKDLLKKYEEKLSEEEKTKPNSDAPDFKE